jgi:hypothetical protein
VPNVETYHMYEELSQVTELEKTLVPLSTHRLISSLSHILDFFSSNQPSSPCLLYSFYTITLPDPSPYPDRPLPSYNVYQIPRDPQRSESSTIMAKHMSNYSSNCNQMQRFLGQESQSTVLASCYSVESSTSKVDGFHYCTTLGAGKGLQLLFNQPISNP